MIKNIGLTCLAVTMAMLLPSMSDAQSKWKKNRNSKYKIYTKNKVKPKVIKKKNRKYQQRTKKALKRKYQLKRRKKNTGVIKNRKKNIDNKKRPKTTIRNTRKLRPKKCNSLCEYHKARYRWLINISNDYNFDANKIK